MTWAYSLVFPVWNIILYKSKCCQKFENNMAWVMIHLGYILKISNPWWHHRYKHQRYQTSNTAPCSGVVSHGAQFGGLRVFTDHTRKQMRSRSLCAVQHFTHAWLHAQTAVHAGNIRTWRTTIILTTGKTRRPLNWAPCRDQNGTGSGISGVYLWMALI